MTTTLILDASRPFQVEDGLLALWRPRGPGRDALAEGLVAIVDVCRNPSCSCTEAQLQTFRIDDRAVQATRKDGTLRITWHDQGTAPRPEGRARLSFDITSGAIGSPEGKRLTPDIAPFFEEPLPFWVLDHLWNTWCETRQQPTDWRTQALDLWQPGELLPAMIAYPDWRPDRYIIEGVPYQVDFLFCVNPHCNCNEARLSVFTIGGADGRELNEAASAQLPIDTMIPIEFAGYGLDRSTFNSIYLAWRKRNKPAETRIDEIRAHIRKRGQELHEAAFHSQRTSVSNHPPQVAGQAPCPCGSGKKFKRCCGARP